MTGGPVAAAGSRNSGPEGNPRGVRVFWQNLRQLRSVRETISSVPGATEKEMIAGTWRVKFKHWTWEYTLTADGKATWRDPLNGMTGAGRWGKAPKVIFFTWTGSKTKESWNLPVSNRMAGWIDANYGIGPAKVEKIAGVSPTPAPPVPPAPTPGPTDADLVNAAFAASRASLRTASARLRQLQSQANALAKADGVQRLSLLTQLNLSFARDIAVISRRLLVPLDPGSQQFRDALDKVISLIEQNLALPNTITVTRTTGKCANPKPAFAWTTIGRKPPDTELCTAWVNARDDLRRDVVTHEYFHSVGSLDISVNSTADALRNANTLAQVVALVNDRTRQHNSDGNEAAVPPLPMP